MESVLEYLGEVIYRTGHNKSTLVKMIAKKSKVSERMVYKWLKSEKPEFAGRVRAALADIEREEAQ